MKSLFERLLKEISLRTGILDRKFFGIYPYQHSPHHLQYLLECVSETKDVPGAIIEIGCANGATTVFLKKHLDYLGCDKRYIAIDTFSGFTRRDVDYEIRERGKSRFLYSAWRQNKIDWVEHSLQLAGVHGVELVQADCSAFDYTEIGGIAFCFIDVDLYRPVLAALEAIHSELAPGAIVIVDDCQPDPMWDGALEAYTEYVGKSGLPSEIVCEKFGIIRKVIQHAPSQNCFGKFQ
jgi:predicted O-methyltransferase YrrM